MNHFTLFSPPLFHYLTLPEEEATVLVRFLDLLAGSGVFDLMSSEPDSGIGRPGFDPCRLLAMVLFAFADNGGTLRDMEARCKYDCRYNFLAGGMPDHSTLSVFINEKIKPQAEAIFSLITKAIFRECGLDCDIAHVDGTKQHAFPNKYKFVWNPIDKHLKLTDKFAKACESAGLESCVFPGAPIKSAAVAECLSALSGRLRASGIDPAAIYRAKGHRLSADEKRFLEFSAILGKCLEYEEQERICGDRNSYYKTDHDATAMCLKEDYYSGLGSNMHAAYSVLAFVSHGLVASYYVSQDRSDFTAFPKALEKHREMFGSYPKKVSGDAGFGNLTNYELLDFLGIEAYVKYNDWEGESSGARPPMYHYGEDGEIYCLNGRRCAKTEIQGRHPKAKGAYLYVVTGCTGCQFMPWCRRYQTAKEGDEKTFEINPRYLMLKEAAKARLLSPEGIEIRVNRSCQVEGAYGQMKWNMGYDRIRRVGIEGVSMEVMLNFLGSNLRKFFRFVRGENPFGYWKAPPGTKPGEFKKPSAKRLATKAAKFGHGKKQPNEIARDSYRRKRKRRR